MALGALEEYRAINARIAEIEALLAQQELFVDPRVERLVAQQFDPLRAAALADLGLVQGRAIEDIGQEEFRTAEALGTRGVRGLLDLTRFAERNLDQLQRRAIEEAGRRGLRLTDTPIAQELARLQMQLGEDIGTNASQLAEDIARELRNLEQEVGIRRQRVGEDALREARQLLAELGGEQAERTLDIGLQESGRRQEALLATLHAELGRGGQALQLEQIAQTERQRQMEEMLGTQGLALERELGLENIALRREEMSLQERLHVAQIDSQERLAAMERALERELQAGRISHEQFLAAQQMAHENEQARLERAQQFTLLTEQFRLQGLSQTQAEAAAMEELEAQIGAQERLQARGFGFEREQSALERQQQFTLLIEQYRLQGLSQAQAEAAAMEELEAQIGAQQFLAAQQQLHETTMQTTQLGFQASQADLQRDFDFDLMVEGYRLQGLNQAQAEAAALNQLHTQIASSEGIAEADRALSRLQQRSAQRHATGMQEAAFAQEQLIQRVNAETQAFVQLQDAVFAAEARAQQAEIDAQHLQQQAAAAMEQAWLESELAMERQEAAFQNQMDLDAARAAQEAALSAQKAAEAADLLRRQTEAAQAQAKLERDLAADLAAQAQAAAERLAQLETDTAKKIADLNAQTELERTKITTGSAEDIAEAQRELEERLFRDAMEQREQERLDAIAAAQEQRLAEAARGLAPTISGVETREGEPQPLPQVFPPQPLPILPPIPPVPGIITEPSPDEGE